MQCVCVCVFWWMVHSYSSASHCSLCCRNGSSPPAVNSPGKFPARYHDDGWHPRLALWQMEGHLKRQYSFTFYLNRPRRHRCCHGYVSWQNSFQPLSLPSNQFTSRSAAVVNPFQRAYAHAEEFRCQETVQHVLASPAQPSPRGFTYPRPSSLL